MDEITKLTLKRSAALMMYEAISQALDDMNNEGLCVCPATKRYLQKALERADTGKTFHYNSRTGEWEDIEL